MQKVELIKYLDEAEEILARNQIDSEILNTRFAERKKIIGEFSAKILFVGGFSAGKSALLNAFLGDATFYGFKHKKKFYNVQLLQQEIEALRQIDASVFLLSHRRNFTKQKRAVITLLEQIYETRKSGDTEIEIF